MIKRIIEKKLLTLSRQFKSIAIIGPRQSGKTTLAKKLFPQKEYVSLESPDIRQYATEDPRGFLNNYRKGAILDEIQNVPSLFSYLQEILDTSHKKGQFILTGSNHFLLQQNISQSLAGRVAYLKILPFSIEELASKNWLLKDDDKLILKGFYPPIYHQKINPNDWLTNYIDTYIHRDVRQIKTIGNLNTFQKFMTLVASRVGQEINYTSLSNDVGVDIKTIQSWIGILEASFIIYLLKPYHKNFNKVIIKRPKLYFYDTAIACRLLRIYSHSQLATHPLKGALFENIIIMEFVKQQANLGKQDTLFFWRDKTGHEIDLLIENKGKLIPIEIKYAQTVNNDFLKNIHYFHQLTQVKLSYLLYRGSMQSHKYNTHILNWRDFFLYSKNTSGKIWS